jgi:hypothetical protein
MWFAIAKASVKATAGRRSIEKRTCAKKAAFSADTSGPADKNLGLRECTN